MSNWKMNEKEAVEYALESNVIVSNDVINPKTGYVNVYIKGKNGTARIYKKQEYKNDKNVWTVYNESKKETIWTHTTKGHAIQIAINEVKEADLDFVCNKYSINKSAFSKTIKAIEDIQNAYDRYNEAFADEIESLQEEGLTENEEEEIKRAINTLKYNMINF